VPTVLNNVVSAALLFAGVIALIFFVVAGYKFMTSGGVPQQVDSARKTLVFAVLGLLLVLCSFGIVKLIAASTGVECITAFEFDQCRH